MKDCYYTPSYLADKLISFVSKRKINSVADFSLGEGQLIKAALRKWPNAQCFGTDISKTTIRVLANKYPSWTLGKCDFLKKKSRAQCKALSKINKGIDLILLNPPFSCVGGTRHKINLDGNNFFASTAMAFVVEALQYLSISGCTYAILPNSVAYSQKDSKLWEFLNRKYSVKILEESSAHHFEKSSSKVLLIAISKSGAKPIASQMYNETTRNNDIEIFRGKLGMHKAIHNPKAKYFLIHSTNLKDNQIKNVQLKCNNSTSKIVGPAVVIPRVGLPNPQKIAIIKTSEIYIISDCIIAIKTDTDNSAEELMACMLKNWETFDSLYKGTGARYITVEKLQKYLNFLSTKNTFSFKENMELSSLNLIAI